MLPAANIDLNMADLEVRYLHVWFSNKYQILSVLECLVLAFLYVGSLYIKPSKLPRDHPTTIKQRFCRVFIVSIIAPLLVWLWSDYSIPITQGQRYHLFRWLGIHTNHMLLAIVLPLVLTMILFTGPLVLDFAMTSCVLPWNNFRAFRVSIIQMVQDLTWQRTVVVAPFTEEFVFRACMLPLLIPVFSKYQAILFCPLFFGLAHIHHAVEGISSGENPKQVWIRVVFQMGYTTIFGAYTAFLFLRTGHLIGPIVTHSFCNCMGFPDFLKISECKYPRLVWATFVIGLIAFILLLYPMTDPSLFNSIYWYGDS